MSKLLSEPHSFVGARKASELLGISPVKLQGLTLQGIISHVVSEPDKRPLWARSELERFKREHKSSLIPARTRTRNPERQ
jgi:hypothetical protein